MRFQPQFASRLGAADHITGNEVLAFRRPVATPSRECKERVSMNYHPIRLLLKLL
jgi:hypothetical protein